MMTEETTLAQLAAEVAQLRQQLETMNQRLDMIYGAVTRLADQVSPAKTAPSPAKSSPQSRPVISPTDMMSPDSMLDSLHQYALQVGLDVPAESVETLKTHSQSAPTPDEETTTSDEPPA
jgi:uncharacterized coiled-coil protein SlyX